MCKYASKHARRFYDPIETCNQARPLRDTVQDATNGFGGGGGGVRVRIYCGRAHKTYCTILCVAVQASGLSYLRLGRV